MTDEAPKTDKATAHGAPRDSSMRVHAHPPTQFLLSCLGTVLLGSWGANGSDSSNSSSLQYARTIMMVRPKKRQSSTLLTALGFGGFALSVGLARTALTTFQRHKTPIPHGYRVQAIVTEGVFSWSRNPIYVSMVAGVVSVGVVCHTWWGALAAAYLAATLHWRVIPYEEAYLAKTFGQRYEEYKVKVPRWILFF
mmetsp:Transcript_16117/g.30375  ORF Transcript_16117/g.30375 Transcript_16117/m.30375 type:complete len:195 (+) Transcript_16117:67-651(+)